MPGTPVLDDIELIIEDIRGSGGGKPPSRDDDGEDSLSLAVRVNFARTPSQTLTQILP